MRDFQIYEIFEILKQSKASIKDLWLRPAYCLLNTPTKGQLFSYLESVFTKAYKSLSSSSSAYKRLQASSQKNARFKLNGSEK